uniref:Homeobox domain-containing protein n=1 Tax=Caenorhabditis tropicalis TaxID=1561998 RepID=A0A1I7TJC5_9PELO
MSLISTSDDKPEDNGVTMKDQNPTTSEPTESLESELDQPASPSPQPSGSSEKKIQSPSNGSLKTRSSKRNAKEPSRSLSRDSSDESDEDQKPISKSKKKTIKTSKRIQNSSSRDRSKKTNNKRSRNRSTSSSSSEAYVPPKTKSKKKKNIVIETDEEFSDKIMFIIGYRDLQIVEQLNLKKEDVHHLPAAPTLLLKTNGKMEKISSGKKSTEKKKPAPRGRPKTKNQRDSSLSSESSAEAETLPMKKTAKDEKKKSSGSQPSKAKTVAKQQPDVLPIEKAESSSTLVNKLDAEQETLDAIRLFVKNDDDPDSSTATDDIFDPQDTPQEDAKPSKSNSSAATALKPRIKKSVSNDVEEEEEAELELTPLTRPPKKPRKNSKAFVKDEKPKRESMPLKRFSPSSRLPQYTVLTAKNIVSQLMLFQSQFSVLQPLYPEFNKIDQSLPCSSNSSILTSSPSPVNNVYIPTNSRNANVRLEDSIGNVDSSSMINHESFMNWTNTGPKPRELEGMSVNEATPILEKWFAENPMYNERNGRSELAVQIGWSKYRIKKWFNEQRQKFALSNGPPPKLTPSLPSSTRQDLNTIFNKRQFVDKKQAEDLGARIGLPGSEVYSWIFYHRVHIFEEFMAGRIPELPYQMRILETAYRTKNMIDYGEVDRLMTLSNATLVQIAGYFRSRRHIDRIAGKDVPIEASLPRLHREASGLDFVFPDAHWEFSVCQRFNDQYSSCEEFRGKPIHIEKLRQQRAEARGYMFMMIPLPLNHSSDYENWTITDIQEFGCQFLSANALKTIREIGIEGIHLKLFCPGNERFYRKLIAGDLAKNVEPTITWEEFLTVGRYIEQIDEATEKWLSEYRNN